MDCIICSIPLTGKQQKFCSTKCKNIYNQGYSKTSIYNAQQERGRLRRIKLLESLGSKCSTCNYNKNSAALSFHHIDEAAKSFAITMRECSNTNYASLELEAAKCIILCANCHMELHYPGYKMVEP